MAIKASLSGFPEWLPAQRIVERNILDTLRNTFEIHGFVEIETRAVEPVSQLIAKGETSKEIYLLSRLQAQPDDKHSDKEIGLHFDLTVPLARYVAENAGQLDFPFKRYQIQKVWRGERPQEGRFREFIQADIDVVGEESLPFHYEIELPIIMARALRNLPIGNIKVLVNNRKISQGFYEAIGITNIEEILRVVDKLDKIGVQKVFAQLVDLQLATDSQAHDILKLAQINGGLEVIDKVKAIGHQSDLLLEGLKEIESFLTIANTLEPGVVTADLKIARGLDYYTGMVYETVLVGHESLGSICSGGRYDRLVKSGKKTYPGVGISIGVSRLVSKILANDLIKPSRKVPTCVLVAVNDEDTRIVSDLVAKQIRARGISAETSPTAAKFGKQIKYADKRGIPFVWFPPIITNLQNVQDVIPNLEHQVKDIRNGEQQIVNINLWNPAISDMHVYLC